MGCHAVEIAGKNGLTDPKKFKATRRVSCKTGSLEDDPPGRIDPKTGFLEDGFPEDGFPKVPENPEQPSKSKKFIDNR